MLVFQDFIYFLLCATLTKNDPHFHVDNEKLVSLQDIRLLTTLLSPFQKM